MSIRSLPDVHDQYIDFQGLRYQIATLISASKSLKPFDLQLRGFYIDYKVLSDADNMMCMIHHYQRIKKANLKCPILLAPNGFLLDGRHRIMKAIANGDKTIKAVKFDNMPFAALPSPEDDDQ